MTDYIWMLDDGCVRGCMSCLSEVPLREFSTPHGEQRPGCTDGKQLLCELCADSAISAMTLWEHNREYHQMARATAQAANFTVKKLGGFKGVKSNCPDCSGAGEMEFVEGYDDQQALVSIPCETCKGVNL